MLAEYTLPDGTGVGFWLVQSKYAQFVGQPAKAHRSWQQSLNLAITLQMPYNQGRAHCEIGRHLPVAAVERERHLQQAKTLFAQMGAMVDLAKVEEAWRLSDSESSKSKNVVLQ